MEKRLENFIIKIITFIITLILIAFIYLTFSESKYAFIYYYILLVPVFLYFIYRKLKMHLSIFILFNLFFIMHVAGGGLYFNGIRLYDIYFSFLRYDNIVHFFGSFIVVLLLFNLISIFLNQQKKYSNLCLFFILLLMTIGIGTVIELLELIGVLFFNASKSVGDYLNNVLDLFFNMLGALIGSLFTIFFYKKKFFKKLI